MVQTRVFPGSNRLFARRVENGLAARTLAHVGWNKARAAAILGLSRKGLYNLLERYEAGAPS
jgi:DNA-binding NtrC family response regulator